MRENSTLFGIAISSCNNVIKEVAKHITSLRRQLIAWPSNQEQAQISEQFMQSHSISDCVGCVDGTHIELDSTLAGDQSYINRKHSPSIVLQV